MPTRRSVYEPILEGFPGEGIPDMIPQWDDMGYVEQPDRYARSSRPVKKMVLVGGNVPPLIGKGSVINPGERLWHYRPLEDNRGIGYWFSRDPIIFHTLPFKQQFGSVPNASTGGMSRALTSFPGSMEHAVPFATYDMEGDPKKFLSYNTQRPAGIESKGGRLMLATPKIPLIFDWPIRTTRSPSNVKSGILSGRFSDWIPFRPDTLSDNRMIPNVHVRHGGVLDYLGDWDTMKHAEYMKDAYNRVRNTDHWRSLERSYRSFQNRYFKGLLRSYEKALNSNIWRKHKILLDSYYKYTPEEIKLLQPGEARSFREHVENHRNKVKKIMAGNDLYTLNDMRVFSQGLSDFNHVSKTIEKHGFDKNLPRFNVEPEVNEFVREMDKSYQRVTDWVAADMLRKPTRYDSPEKRNLYNYIGDSNSALKHGFSPPVLFGLPRKRAYFTPTIAGVLGGLASAAALNKMSASENPYIRNAGEFGNFALDHMPDAILSDYINKKAERSPFWEKYWSSPVGNFLGSIPSMFSKDVYRINKMKSELEIRNQINNAY